MKAFPQDHRAPVEYREHWLVMLNDGQGRGGRILASRTATRDNLEPICSP